MTSTEVRQELARARKSLQDDRALADYDVAFTPGSDRVRKRVKDAARFIEAASERIC